MGILFGKVLGLFGSDPQEYRDRMSRRMSQSSALSADAIEALLEKRRAARLAKDFKRSDLIRDELLAKGVEIKDRPDGITEWKFR